MMMVPVMIMVVILMKMTMTTTKYGLRDRGHELFYRLISRKNNKSRPTRKYTDKTSAKLLNQAIISGALSTNRSPFWAETGNADDQFLLIVGYWNGIGSCFRGVLVGYW